MNKNTILNLTERILDPIFKPDDISWIKRLEDGNIDSPFDTVEKMLTEFEGKEILILRDWTWNEHNGEYASCKPVVLDDLKSVNCSGVLYFLDKEGSELCEFCSHDVKHIIFKQLRTIGNYEFYVIYMDDKIPGLYFKYEIVTYNAKIGETAA